WGVWSLASFAATCGAGTLALAPPPTLDETHRVAIIGGGSAGIFAAAVILDDAPEFVDVKIYEATGEVLRTMRLSGQKHGVLRDTSLSPREILNAGYIRGRREVTSLLTKHFPPVKQQLWFEDRGVRFDTRQDGSMVPSDHGADACEALLRGGVLEHVECRAKITSITREADTKSFKLIVNGVRVDHCDSVVLATGNSCLGLQLARELGHTVATPVRSCFAFKLSDDSILSILEDDGRRYVLPHVRMSYKVKLKGQKRPRVFKSEGPAHFEANGDFASLGGMAALSLSSAAAHELREEECRGELFVHFVPDHFGGQVERLEEYLWQYRQDNRDKVIGDRCPLLHQYVDYDDYDWETESFRTISNESIPPDLWGGLTRSCGAPRGSTWGNLSPKKTRKLAETIVGCRFSFVGRNASGDDPFMNTGGILLKEMDMSKMESKILDGLHCCGQILDGDTSHITYCLMRDFVTGKMAGENAVLHALKSRDIIANNE
ncbi:hypothetical protein THAOC_08552, partial [Thalassiosira oceanica]